MSKNNKTERFRLKVIIRVDVFFGRVVSYLNVKSLPWGTGELDEPAAFCLALAFLEQ